MMTVPPADREPSTASPVGSRRRPPLVLQAGRSAVAFMWHGDRWRHVVSVDDHTRAASLEDVADGRDPEWPASPPLVEVSAVETRCGRAILAVGVAGRAHFSASISPCPAEPDALLFELACRATSRPAWLGSTYEIAGATLRVAAAILVPDHPATIRWSYLASPAGIRAVPPALLSWSP